MDNVQAQVSMGLEARAEVRADSVMGMGLRIGEIFEFVARDKDGNIKWIERVRNLVVNEGLNDVLSKYLKGSSYTASHFCGLINNSGFTALAAGDTAAQINGTNQWTELTNYSQSVRQAMTWGSVASQSVDNSASPATFTINATVTIKGAFVVTSSTKAGTSGLIFGETSFSAARSLVSGDTLTVTVTATDSSL